MKGRWMTSCKGVTLLELMVALGLSMLILGVATTLFKNSMDASNRGLSQIEMQQNLRTALNAVARDVSTAGVGGFPRTGVALAQGSAVKYGCDHAPAKPATPCPPFIGGTYPDGTLYTGGTYTNGTLYPINVFNSEGPKILGNSLAKNTDVIVTVSVDSTFCRGTPVTPDVTAFTITLPAVKPTSCTSGTLTAATGDVFMLSSSAGNIVATVTDVNAAKTVLTFGDDKGVLNMNQPATTSPVANTLESLPSAGGVTATRLNVVTYYMSFTTPTLMRQVNANTPVPLAENIENLQFTYDLFTIYKSNGMATLAVTKLDPAATPPQDSTQIRKVNINVTARSRFPDATGQFRRATLTTFVSPRSLSFFDRYAN